MLGVVMLSVWCCGCDVYVGWVMWACAVERMKLSVWCRVCDVGCVMSSGMLRVWCWVCDVECVMARVCWVCDVMYLMLSVWWRVCVLLGECCYTCVVVCAMLSVWRGCRVELGILSVWCWVRDVAGVVLNVWHWVCGSSRLPQRTFSTSLAPKVKIQASKASIFHETFTKSENPDFQDEHFPRDFWQKRTSGQTPCITNPNGTAGFNTSKTRPWNCKPQSNCDANVSLSRNVCREIAFFQPSSLLFRHFPKDIKKM